MVLERVGEVEDKEWQGAREQGEAGVGVVEVELLEMDWGVVVDGKGKVGEGVMVLRRVRWKCMEEVSQMRK